MYPERLYLAEDEKALIRQVMHFKQEYRIEIPPQPYVLYHIRTGDDNMEKTDITVESYSNLLDKFPCPTGASRVLISDNPSLATAMEKYGYLAYPQDNASHTGLTSDASAYEGTIRDVQLMMSASQINSLTSYSWISGFTHWISVGFNVPLYYIHAECPSPTLLETSNQQPSPSPSPNPTPKRSVISRTKPRLLGYVRK
jgi:hypothetical protein